MARKRGLFFVVHPVDLQMSREMQLMAIRMAMKMAIRMAIGWHHKSLIFSVLSLTVSDLNHIIIDG